MHTPRVGTAPGIKDAVTSFMATADSMSDLRLIRAVDETTDALAVDRRFFENHARLGQVLVESIRNLPVEPEGYVDPEDALTDLLDLFIGRLMEKTAEMNSKRGAISMDANLRSHHCDQLHTAYQDAIVAIEASMETARDIQAALGGHDLAAEPRPALREYLEDVDTLHDRLVEG